MIYFNCDYTEGAHPEIMRRLLETNLVQTVGYGEDEYCESARRRILALCQNENAQVHFLVGGTQANFTVISAALRAHQAVVAAVSGHIAVHETGAVEATGHKVITLPSDDGKITAAQVRACYDAHWNDSTHEHMAQPAMVYLSNPTENGTLYSKAELTAISDVCRACGLTLFVDGARMGYGLASPKNDLTLADYAALCDVFYIGGTKVGALFGEAVVICKPELQRDFRYHIKQRGGMLAKGRLLGVQFDTLFTDELYFEISRHAVDLALELRAAFEKKGWPLLYDSWTNQQFPVLPDEVYERLKEKFVLSFWEKTDEHHTAVRVCTSWATTRESVQALLDAIAQPETHCGT